MTTDDGPRGFARYREGGRLVAEGVSALDEPLTLTVALPGGRLGLDVNCDVAEDYRVGYVISINGVVDSAGGPCSRFSGSSGWEPLGAAELARFNLGVGDSVPVTVTAVDFAWLQTHSIDAATLEPATVAGTIRVAVYDYLGPDAYPYPNRPETLTALTPPESSDIDTILDQVRADPADPLAPRSMKVTVQERWTSIDLSSQTPGRLTITVDGHPAATFDWWNYRQTFESLTLNDLPLAHERRLHVGDTVIVTITPARVTGDWLAQARRQS